MKYNLELTKLEWQELRFFVNAVQSWNSGGPYGDGEAVVDKKGYARMQGILKKLQNTIIV